MKEILENNLEDFQVILENLQYNSRCAFDFSPQGESRFGVCLTLINHGQKITSSFNGLHPCLESFLFVALSRHGGFGFDIFNRTNPFDILYIQEKLELPESDAEGFKTMLDYLSKELSCA